MPDEKLAVAKVESRVRFFKRRDPGPRRWFAIIRGHGMNDMGRVEITRVLFPWFYIDLLRVKDTSDAR